LGAPSNFSAALAAHLTRCAGIDYIMPTTICILVAKWVSDAFGRDGIYDELIVLHDYPYLNNKMDFVFNETTADVMKARDLCVINAQGSKAHCPFRQPP
jgi:chloride channel 3/4/5